MITFLVTIISLIICFVKTKEPSPCLPPRVFLLWMPNLSLFFGFFKPLPLLSFYVFYDHLPTDRAMPGRAGRCRVVLLRKRDFVILRTEQHPVKMFRKEDFSCRLNIAFCHRLIAGWTDHFYLHFNVRTKYGSLSRSLIVSVLFQSAISGYQIISSAGGSIPHLQ